MPSITATTTERCPCCSIPNTLQCRTRGGTATLCGHSEFGTASTPPKKYRVKTASGTVRACQWDGASCGAGTQQGADKVVYGGSCTYNSATCATTNTLNADVYSETGAIGCPGSPAFSSNVSLACDVTFTPATGFDDTITTTSYKQTANGTSFMNGGFLRCPEAGDYREYALTTEDTESDALNRLLAGAGGTWGSWIDSGGVGCTGTPPSCCLAKYESRTSGFSFAYAEAEARVTATGLTPSTGYTAKIELYRRAYGSGSYVHYQTATVTGTSDGSGNLTTSAATVTNTKGYETYAASSSLFVT